MVDKYGAKDEVARVTTEYVVCCVLVVRVTGLRLEAAIVERRGATVFPLPQ